MICLSSAIPNSGINLNAILIFSTPLLAYAIKSKGLEDKQERRNFNSQRSAPLHIPELRAGKALEMSGVGMKWIISPVFHCLPQPEEALSKIAVIVSAPS